MAIEPKDPNKSLLFCDGGCATEYLGDDYNEEDYDDAFPDPEDTCSHCGTQLGEED